MDDEIVEGGRLGLGEQVPLAGTLDLEDGQRLAAADQGHRAGIGRRGGQVVDVGPRAGGLLNEGQRFLDGAEGAQAEQVKLDEAEALHVVFVDLQGAHAVGRDAYRHEVRQRLTGEHHPAVMEARDGAAGRATAGRSPAGAGRRSRQRARMDGSGSGENVAMTWRSSLSWLSSSSASAWCESRLVRRLTSSSG